MALYQCKFYEEHEIAPGRHCRLSPFDDCPYSSELCYEDEEETNPEGCQMNEQKRYVITEKQVNALRLELPLVIVDDLCSHLLDEEIEEIRKEERKLMLEIFKEIEDGVSLYEDYISGCGDHSGMYIPTNVVRRLIEIRKERIKSLT